MKSATLPAQALAWAIFIAVMAALVPHRVIVRGDDFGYVESAAETIRAGRLVQSDWLGPFNVPLPFASAGVYRLSRNFWLATLGVAVAVAFVNFGLMQAWLRANGMEARIGAFALATCPWWLNKAVEYSGVTTGLALLLGALLAWRRGRRWLFFALLIVGIANRQSIVCLLAFPLVAAIREWRRERKADPVLVVGMAVVAAVAIVLDRLLPPTFARAWVAAQACSTLFVGDALQNFALGLVIMAGLRATWNLLRGESPMAAWRENLARPGLPLGLTVIGAWIALRGSAAIACEAPGLDRIGPLMLLAATLVGGWLGRWRPFPPAEFLICLGGYAALVALRGQWWDYYFLEPAIVLIGADARGDFKAAPRASTFGWALLCALNLGYAIQLQAHLRAAETTLVAYERALRKGSVAITEVSEGSFGYLGWKLFATATRRGLEDARLSDFLRYVEVGRTHVIDGNVWVNRQGPRRSLHPSGEKWPLPADWRDRPLPLTNAEWREALSRPPAAS